MNGKARALSLIAAGAIAGGILAGTLTANAATAGTPGSSTDSSSSTGTSSGSGSSQAPGDQFGSTPVRPDEQALDAALTASLTQKAEAKTGGTVFRVETDAGDATYEAHVRKSDGTVVTVKFDGSGNVTGVEDGMGDGDPAPSGRPTG